MRWARENPERYSEIAALPLSQQNAELRHAIGYDPDLIREEHEEAQRVKRHLETFADAAALPSQNFIRCSCGACVRNDQQECPICGEELEIE